MNSVFINLSNHPSGKWDEEQKKAAMHYGEIIDIPFPEIPAQADEREVEELADQYLDQILQHKCGAVMVQGEFTFTYHLVKQLEEKHIPALAACSERSVEEIVEPDGSNARKVSFRFVRFRRYT